MQDSGKSGFAAGSAALIGLLTCLTLTIFTGDDIAWDSNLYYLVAVPVMALLAYMLGYSFPDRPWRWVFSMAAGQFCSIAFVEDALVLWWLTAGFLLLASVPQLIAAYVGASVAWNRIRPSTRR